MDWLAVKKEESEAKAEQTGDFDLNSVPEAPLDLSQMYVELSRARSTMLVGIMCWDLRHTSSTH